MVTGRSGWIAAFVLVWCALPAHAQQDPAVMRGLQYLQNRGADVEPGEAGLMALAMIKAEVPASNPGLAACLAKAQSLLRTSAFVPQRQGGKSIYEAAVIIMALTNLDPTTYRPQIEAAAQHILAHQNANGSWDYYEAGRLDKGDCSISQYALLGLWEAENAGVVIPASVWDRAAAWYLSVQSGQGSWNYHRDEGGPETLSMTAAGVGSLLLSNRQLTQYRHARDTANPLLVPVVPEGQAVPQKYEVSTSAATIDQGAKRGVAWLGHSFALADASKAPVIGGSVYYFLYGMERIGALADKDTLGGIDWYAQGSRFIQASQQADGSWKGEYGPEVNTSYAILFLTKATKKSIRKFEIKRLGSGTLLGGRGLPKDLTSLTVAQGRVVVRPMNGAVEGMLRVLEDPRAESADSALAGLIERYQTQGSDALRPFKDRFRKLLNDRDPGVRRVAVWALGRTEDLDVVPLIVTAMKHPQEDDSVVAEARGSLQFLSRKIDGYGPPIPSTPELRVEAAKKWLAWYNTIKPIDQNTPDDAPDAPPKPAPLPQRSTP